MPVPFDSIKKPSAFVFMNDYLSEVPGFHLGSRTGGVYPLPARGVIGFKPARMGGCVSEGEWPINLEPLCRLLRLKKGALTKHFA